MELSKIIQKSFDSQASAVVESKPKRKRSKHHTLSSPSEAWIYEQLSSNEGLLDAIRSFLVSDPTFITEIEDQINIPQPNLQNIINQLLNNQSFINQVASQIEMPVPQTYAEGIFPVVSGYRNGVIEENFNTDLMIIRRGNLVQVTVVRNPVAFSIDWSSVDAGDLRQMSLRVRAPEPFVIGNASGVALVSVATSLTIRRRYVRIDVPAGPDADWEYDELQNLLGAKLSSEDTVGDEIPLTSLAIGRFAVGNVNRVIQFNLRPPSPNSQNAWYTYVSLSEGTTFTFYDPNPPNLD